MKLAVIGLCLLGAVAAACAALLVNSLRLQAANARLATSVVHDVSVLYASRAMPAMTVVDSSYVVPKTITTDKAPKSYLSNPTEVVGKVLSRPIAEGEHFTPDAFAESGNGQQVAAVIPAGKRAVGIAVSNYAGLEGLLSPGSMVDVMVSLKPGDGAEGARRDALTTTLLENIQVIAIEQQTVVSPKSVIPEGSSGSRSNDTHCITLLVDSRQAKILELAMEQGTLSLALRNPLDTSSADREAVWLRSLTGHDPFGNGPTPVPTKLETQKQTGPTWDIVIMRSGSAETKSFPIQHEPGLAKKDGSDQQQQ
jgi:pilus assembly protein CpaB